MNDVEILPEVFADDFTGGVGGFVSDVGEAIELKRRRHGSSYCDSDSVSLDTEVVVTTIIGKLGVEKKKMMAL